MLLLFVIHIYYQVDGVIRLQKFQDQASDTDRGTARSTAQPSADPRQKAKSCTGSRTASPRQLQAQTPGTDQNPGRSQEKDRGPGKNRWTSAHRKKIV